MVSVHLPMIFFCFTDGTVPRSPLNRRETASSRKRRHSWLSWRMRMMTNKCIHCNNKICLPSSVIVLLLWWHSSWILPRLLQRSKECRGHYSTLYHATSQWIMRSDTHLFFWHNVKKSVHLKFKIGCYSASNTITRDLFLNYQTTHW